MGNAAKNLDLLGTGKVFRDRRTGELVVKKNTIRRFAGDDDAYYGEDPDDGDDDEYGEDLGYEEDEYGDDSDDEAYGEDPDYGDDDEDETDGVGEDDDDDDDLGARRRRRRRRMRRRGRGRGRGRRRGRARPRGRKKSVKKWGQTVISGEEGNPVAGGAISIKIRLQHEFRAEDVTFTETTPGSGGEVSSIFFGDRLVWSNPNGVPITVFATTGFMRGLLKGQKLRAGLDITVNGNVGAAGDTLTAILKGLKPVEVC